MHIIQTKGRRVFSEGLSEHQYIFRKDWSVLNAVNLVVKIIIMYGNIAQPLETRVSKKYSTVIILVCSMSCRIHSPFRMKYLYYWINSYKKSAVHMICVRHRCKQCNLTSNCDNVNTLVSKVLSVTVRNKDCSVYNPCLLYTSRCV